MKRKRSRKMLLRRTRKCTGSVFYGFESHILMDLQEIDNVAAGDDIDFGKSQSVLEWLASLLGFGSKKEDKPADKTDSTAAASDAPVKADGLPQPVDDAIVPVADGLPRPTETVAEPHKSS
jgi:hypothetical protein